MSVQSATEQVSPRYRGLDAWDDDEILATLWEAQSAAVAAVRPALGAIARSAAEAAARLGDTGRLLYVGAGTSGRVGAQDGIELPPTFGWPKSRLIIVLAGGEFALVGSAEGAEDDVNSAYAACAVHAPAAPDVVVAIAASGTTPFTLAFTSEARKRGAFTLGVASVAASPLLTVAECPILIETGAEPLAGSTRLKAGTAQKVVLNLFSTLLMVRLGRVHEGLMVDMIPTNVKLRNRAERIVATLAGSDAETAATALAASDGNIKHAVLRLRGLSASEAEAALARHRGRLRPVLEEITP